MATVSSFEAIPSDLLQELRSKTWIRGVYKDELKKFVDSDEAGVKVNLESGVFAGKKPETVKTGFYNVISKLGEDEKNVAVMRDGDDVYLFRTDK